MLGKLLKYDFKNLLLPCLPVYLGGLILTLLGMFLVGTARNYPEVATEPFNLQLTIYIVANLVLSIILFGISCIILFALIVIAMDFYHTVFAKRGYLTHTLPVSTKEILLSKIISGFICIFLSTCVALILYYLLALADREAVMDFNHSNFMIVVGVSSYGFDDPEANSFLIALFTSIGLIILSSSIYSVLTIYMSIALGHLTKYKVVGSLVILLILCNFVSNLYALPAIILFISEATEVVNHTGHIFISPTILYCSIISIASVAYYFVIKKIINRKLNLI